MERYGVFCEFHISFSFVVCNVVLYLNLSYEDFNILSSATID